MENEAALALQHEAKTKALLEQMSQQSAEHDQALTSVKNRFEAQVSNLTESNLRMIMQVEGLNSQERKEEMDAHLAEIEALTKQVDEIRD